MITDIELERNKIIARNFERLKELGLQEAVTAFSAVLRPPQEKKKNRSCRQVDFVETQPPRRSLRLGQQEMQPQNVLGSEVSNELLDGQ